MEVFSTAGCKCIDKYTIENIGIPSIVLMENAASEIVKLVKNYGEKVVIVVGNGNNGGDGLAVARKLIGLGKCVKVYIVKVSKNNSEDFNVNLNVLNNLKISLVQYDESCEAEFKKSISECDYLVDALFGVGLNRDVEGTAKDVIEKINNFCRKVISIDIPSGLNGDNGKAMGASIEASETVTIEAMKKGFFVSKSKEKLGTVSVVNIGIPLKVKEMFSEGYTYVEEYYLVEKIPNRELYGHKGTYGKVMILAGSDGFTGAAYIVTESAVRTGSGLVTLVVPKEIQNILSTKLIEAMTKNYEDDNLDKLIKDSDVIICGPGLGQSLQSKSIFERVIKRSSCKLVIDADGLNILSQNKELFKFIENRAILTPHPGELSRLLGQSIEDIESDRVDICKNFALDNKIVLLLKGYNTVVSDGVTTNINSTGNSKMANGGMGDCLSGIIGSLIGQGMNILEAGTVGTYIHGYIGDKLSEKNYTVTARDIINNLPNIIEDLRKLE